MCSVSSHPHLAKSTHVAGTALLGFSLLLIAGCARPVSVPDLPVDLELIRTKHVGSGMCEAKVVVSNVYGDVLKSTVIQGTVYDVNLNAIGQFVGSFGDVLPGQRGIQRTFLPNITCEDIVVARGSAATFSLGPYSYPYQLNANKIAVTLTPVNADKLMDEGRCVFPDTDYYIGQTVSEFLSKWAGLPIKPILQTKSSNVEVYNCDGSVFVFLSGILNNYMLF